MSDDSKDLSPDNTERGREVSRRTLLRAGTIAASAGVASVAAATIATPAAATDGQPIIQGQDNTGGNATTGIINNSSDKPALALENPSGSPLQITPSSPISYDAPDGSLWTDDAGGLYIAGSFELGDEGPIIQKYVGRLSSAFSTSVLTVTPERWLVTLPNFTMPNGQDGRAYVVPGSANFDSAGRVLPKNDPNVPDLTLDLSGWFYEWGIYGVQGTLLAMNATANGWVSLYDSDVWPGTSSMNFKAGEIRDVFTQMGLTWDGKLHFKVSTPVVLVFDIFAFICGNGTFRLYPNEFGAAARRADAGPAASPTRIPQQPRPRKRNSG